MCSAQTEPPRWRRRSTDWALVTRGTTKYTFLCLKTPRKKVDMCPPGGFNMHPITLHWHYQTIAQQLNNCNNIPMKILLFVTSMIITCTTCSLLPGHRCTGAILHVPEHFSAVPAHMVSRDQKCAKEGNACLDIVFNRIQLRRGIIC